MNQLVLGVVLPGASLPVTVGFVNGLGLLLALVFIQILAQVQDPPAAAAAMVLMKKTKTRRSQIRPSLSILT